MNRIGMIASLAALALATSLYAEDKVTPRNIARKGIDDQGRVHGDLAEVTGLKTATSLGYKILLVDENGAEQSVDPAKTVFQPGQQFRIEIEADSDLFIYVFHEGPDAVRTVLMPDAIDQGRVPMVKRGQKKVIPDDGTYFEFTPPAGKEKLLVYASPERRDELTPKEAFENMDKGEMIELKNQQDKIISDSTKNQPTEAITAPSIEQVAEVLETKPEFRIRGGLRWSPEGMESDGGKTVLVGSFDENVRPSLAVEITLETK